MKVGGRVRVGFIFIHFFPAWCLLSLLSRVPKPTYTLPPECLPQARPAREEERVALRDKARARERRKMLSAAARAAAPARAPARRWPAASPSTLRNFNIRPGLGWTPRRLGRRVGRPLTARQEAETEKRGAAAAQADPSSSTPSPSTFPAAAALFAAHPTPRLVVALLLAGTLTRAWMSGSGCPVCWLDAVAAAAGAAGWVVAEPALHALLHARGWAGAAIHADHHAAPYHHVSIDPPALVLGWIGGVSLLTAATVAFSPAPPGPALAGLLGYAAAGLGYEAVHFGAHCAYRPGTAWGRALKAHHAAHHLRSERHDVDGRRFLAFQAPCLDGWDRERRVSGEGGAIAARAGEAARAAPRGGRES